MRRTAILATLLAILCAAICYAADTLDVYFIDVGHGDAILVDYGDWECLIDTGYENQWLADDTDWDLLEGLIAEPLEVFALSHPDRDHYSALDVIGCVYRIEVVLHAATLQAKSAVDELLAELDCGCPELYESPPVAREVFADADSPVSGMEPDWRVLHPTSVFFAEEDDKNENSLVLLATLGRVSFLFLGDIEHKAELSLQATEALDGTLILKVAHHGSDSSTSIPFLEWANPELAIISADADDLHPDTAAILGDYGVPFLTTYDNATICVSTDGAAVWVTPGTLYGQQDDSTD